jgi:hypothetical protein
MKQQKILTILTLILILLITTLTNAELYYKLNIEYNNPNLEIQNIDVIFSQQNLEFNQGNHYLELTSFNNNQISTTNFTIPNIIAYDNINEFGELTSGGINILNTTNFNIYIPYNQDAKQLTIYNQQNQEQTTISLAHLSKNPQATEIINNKKTTQKEIQKETTQQPESDTPWKILLWILIILTIIAIIILTRKKK